MPAILHLLKLSAVVTLDTGPSAEQDGVVYHQCLLEENCGQKLPQKSVYFLPVIMIWKTSLSQLQIKLEKKALQIRSHTRWRNWSGNEDLDKLFNEDNSEFITSLNCVGNWLYTYFPKERETWHSVCYWPASVECCVVTTAVGSPYISRNMVECISFMYRVCFFFF